MSRIYVETNKDIESKTDISQYVLKAATNISNPHQHSTNIDV